MAESAPPSRRSRAIRRLRALPRHPGQADAMVLLHGALDRRGWGRSVREARPVAADGSPIPWLPYPVIGWLRAWVGADTSILEFGGGQSTKWFAERARRIDTIETDSRWAAELAAATADWCEVRHVEAARLRAVADDPIAGIDELGLHPPYDLVLIDGAERPSCLRLAPWLVAETGVVILDNSERHEYQVSIRELEDEGFHRLDLTGVLPGGTDMGTSSLLFRRLGPWSRPDGAVEGLS